MRHALLACLAGLSLASPTFAQPVPAGGPSRLDFPGFAQLTDEVAPYRAQRLVSLEQFRAMAREKDTLILDARSPAAFAAGHIEGAVNLTFTDFTAEALAEAIGDPDRRILIYCNNNFANDVAPVRMKAVRLALNIQTFVNLVGYGYRNVYELGETIDLNDPKVRWVSGAA
jgi:phage shock protein E